MGERTGYWLPDSSNASSVARSIEFEEGVHPVVEAPGLGIRRTSQRTGFVDRIHYGATDAHKSFGSLNQRQASLAAHQAIVDGHTATLLHEDFAAVGPGSVLHEDSHHLPAFVAQRHALALIELAVPRLAGSAGVGDACADRWRVDRNHRSRVSDIALVHALEKSHQLGALETTPTTGRAVMRHLAVVRPATKRCVVNAQEIRCFGEVEPGIV